MGSFVWQENNKHTVARKTHKYLNRNNNGENLMSVSIYISATRWPSKNQNTHTTYMKIKITILVVRTNIYIFGIEKNKVSEYIKSIFYGVRASSH